jgi:L-2-hydroxyglutarate oxidase
MLPNITEDHVEFAGCGIRAQAISDSGDMIDDFVILGKERQVHVLNAPSPAATASFAIGDYILLEIEKIPEFDRLVSLKPSFTSFRFSE